MNLLNDSNLAGSMYGVICVWNVVNTVVNFVLYSSRLIPVLVALFFHKFWISLLIALIAAFLPVSIAIA
jgi:hypothetical protein